MLPPGEVAEFVERFVDKGDGVFKRGGQLPGGFATMRRDGGVEQEPEPFFEQFAYLGGRSYLSLERLIFAAFKD